MVYDKNKQNNAKQQNGGQQQINDPNAPAQKVVEAARQSYAMQHGGVMPGEQKPMNGAPGGNIPAVGTVAQPMNFFGNGGGVQGAYDYTPNTPAPAPEYGTQGVQITDPAATKQNDLGGLSQALANAGGQPQQAQFQADPTQRDGGFFGWLGGLIPKNRPGLRDGETPDEYDDRMARNTKMYFTLADALRHLGNIVNTSKYAPLQQFNDPNAMIEQRYQQRKAERQKQAKLDADAAYKKANMDLKERAQQAADAYRKMNLGFKQQAEERAAAKDKFDRDYKTAVFNRMLYNDKFNHKLASDRFEESKRRNAVSEGQGAARIVLAQERNGIARQRLAHSIATGGGGGSSASLTNLSSPTGHMNRKKDLNSIEKKQLAQHLIKNGYINKKNLDTYKQYSDMGDSKNMGNLVNNWIAYAANMPGNKGDAFRKLLKDHYMYGETNTTSTPKTSAKQASAGKGKLLGKKYH